MKYLKKYIFVLLSIVQLNLQAIEYKGQISSHSFSLLYQNQEATIDHQEASSDTNYTPLNEEVDQPIHGLQLQLAKEFLPTYLFSFTLSGRYGQSIGSIKKTNQTSALTYEQEVSSEVYGAGLTLNLNFSLWSIKVQPFIGAFILKNKHSFDLSYSPSEDDESSKTNIIYKTDHQTTQYSLGVRFIDYFTGLLSYFSLDYLTHDTLEVNTSSNLSQLSNIQVPKPREYAFSIGFGVLF